MRRIEVLEICYWFEGATHYVISSLFQSRINHNPEEIEQITSSEIYNNNVSRFAGGLTSVLKRITQESLTIR